MVAGPKKGRERGGGHGVGDNEGQGMTGGANP